MNCKLINFIVFSQMLLLCGSIEVDFESSSRETNMHFNVYFIM